MKEFCIKTRLTSTSRTVEARVLSPQNCKMVYLEFRQKSHYPLHHIIVIRGDWLRKTINNKYKINGAAVYVGSSLKVQNPFFSIGKL